MPASFPTLVPTKAIIAAHSPKTGAKCHDPLPMRLREKPATNESTAQASESAIIFQPLVGSRVSTRLSSEGSLIMFIPRSVSRPNEIQQPVLPMNEEIPAPPKKPRRVMSD